VRLETKQKGECVVLVATADSGETVSTTILGLSQSEIEANAKSLAKDADLTSKLEMKQNGDGLW